MLEKMISVRANDLWISWAKRLANQSGRSMAEFIRDLVYLMIFDDDLGDAICAKLRTEQISYNN